MAEKRMTGYAIGEEFKALFSLADEIAESERDITEEDEQYLKEEAKRIGGDFTNKINGCCKLVKNLEMEADVAEAEKNALKGQVERLTKRANARLNVAKRVKNCVIGYLMDLIGEKKIKTELFSVQYQNTQKSVKEVDGFFNPDLIPSEFLKREINPAAVKKAIEEGRLYEKTEEEIKKNPLLKGKLFFKSDNKELPYVSYLGNQAIYIR